jgi:hypothetical protein
MMNTTTKRFFAILLVIIVGGALFFAGTVYSQSRSNKMGYGSGMMGFNNNSSNTGFSMMTSQNGQTFNNSMMGMGMMNGNMMSNNMMGNNMGMMGSNMMSNGYGMMGGLGATADPLTIVQATDYLNAYLADLNQPNLTLGEIMIFDNHAYAQIMDESTGKGAYEVLVDATNGNVFPEPGPNMMWNTEYGAMEGFAGMMGQGMMGNFGYTDDGEVTVSPTEAVDLAQNYLDAYLSGTTADENPDGFPGYYTLHVERDGEIAGMLVSTLTVVRSFCTIGTVISSK